MRFPENYILNHSTNQDYKQFGNRVIVDMIHFITKEIINYESIFYVNKKI